MVCLPNIEGLFKKNGLKITCETGLKNVDFLDVNFDLTSETYKPYKKPNNKLLYVNKDSNHPATVLKHIPNSVNKRLNSISSNEQVFQEAKTEYENALKDAGYSTELKYNQNKDKTKKKRNRKRNIVWYNPPFSKSVKTDLGRKFLYLLKKHFPENHKLHKIINKNTVKLSYSCTKNIKRVIQSHNSKILNKKETNSKTCSCPKAKKKDCPLQNKCLSSCIVYEAKVKKTGKNYIGISEKDFKSRLSAHNFSFRHEHYQKATTLSKHVWETNQSPEPDIEWSILKQSTGRKPCDRECQLCLEEKLQILKQRNNPNCLNRRSELSNRCVIFHRSKQKLDEVKN